MVPRSHLVLRKMGAVFMRYASRSFLAILFILVAVLYIPFLVATTKPESIKSYAKYVEIPGAKAVGGTPAQDASRLIEA